MQHPYVHELDVSPDGCDRVQRPQLTSVVRVDCDGLVKGDVGMLRGSPPVLGHGVIIRGSSDIDVAFSGLEQRVRRLCRTPALSSEPMEIGLSIAALVVAVVSALVAIWQGVMARDQLKSAKDTEGRTERALEEIRTLSRQSDQTLTDLKRDINDRITKILDQRIANDQQGQEMGARFMEEMFKGLGQQPPKE
ncbi:hypothetical protein ACL00U_04070 [Curtobacterium poinsettiae]|uniref:Uncharacterized protein n=1 Tax=Curtobacterium flaccumfaciens pv. flaccumfaciens TaxID=138532 RepID=A0A9Q2W519_9MICO|nr:hypothetical protein [Curtobacterium flaccumfaciens]MBT1542607.1 hypothetical protein [Curtobacterium flaccumfaciens pv. flaccumfaciens]